MKITINHILIPALFIALAINIYLTVKIDKQKAEVAQMTQKGKDLLQELKAKAVELRYAARDGNLLSNTQECLIQIAELRAQVASALNQKKRTRPVVSKLVDDGFIRPNWHWDGSPTTITIGDTLMFGNGLGGIYDSTMHLLPVDTGGTIWRRGEIKY